MRQIHRKYELRSRPVLATPAPGKNGFSAALATVT